MSVIPLGERVLIKPLVQPITSDLLVIPETHYEPEHIGEVVAIGDGLESRKRAIERFADRAIDEVRSHVVGATPVIRAVAILEALKADYQPEHVCQVGDMVAFAPTSGQEITIDGELHIIMREDDLLAIVESVEAS